MTTPFDRRRDPTTFTQGWEIAVGAIGLAVIGLVLAALAGLGIAAVVFGGGWVWPHGTDAIGRTIGGLVSGHPSRGLPPVEAARTAAPALTYVCVAVCETAMIGGSVAAGLALARRFRNDGMATRHDAEQALGVSELRRAREIIRPDMYGHRTGTDHATTRMRPSAPWRRRGEQ